MLMKTQSINDRTLLLAVGFFGPDKTGTAKPDTHRIAIFCGVSERTAQRWIKNGLPNRARQHFENLLAGDYLPAAWRRWGVKISADKIYLQSGHSVPIDTIRHWPFIAAAVDWSKIPITVVQQTGA